MWSPDFANGFYDMNIGEGIKMKNVAIKKTGVIVLLCAIAGSAVAKDKLPDVTEDGLKRIESKNVQAVYWQDGASLKPYTQVMLVDTAVAFRKDWKRDYNRSQASLQNQVRDSDMDRIKTALSAAFNQEFTKVLEKGGYEIVDNTAENVLLLRAAIINLDVAAPDLKNASMSRTFTASAGEMTLYLELYDSATGAKIGQVIDAERARDKGSFSVSNSVTNRAEANRMLSRWAELLVKALDEAKAAN